MKALLKAEYRKILRSWPFWVTLAAAVALTVGLSGCGAVSTLLGRSTVPTDPKTGFKIDTTPWVTPGPEPETTFAFDEPITVRVFSDDILSMVVNRAEFYSSLDEAAIDPADKKTVCFDGVGNFVLKDDGSLVEGTKVVMVDVTVTALESPDGSGAFSENEHILYTCLTYDQKVTNFDNFYFSFVETGEIHRVLDENKFESQFNHYWLPTGQTVEMRLGFLVPKNIFSERDIFLTLSSDKANTDTRQFVLLHKGEEA